MPLDKTKIRHAFSAAAKTYDGVAALQRTVATGLLSNLPSEKIRGTVLDIGAGTGFLSLELLKHQPQQLIALDLALPMLHTTRNKLNGKNAVHTVCADAERLPFAAHSIDHAFSSLALQWCTDLGAALAEVRRVLKPGGEFLFSTFGPQSLHELKSAWATVDSFQHVNDFQSGQGITDALAQAGFIDFGLESTLHITRYPSVMDLMRELKHLGASNALKQRNKHLTGKRQLQAMMDAYPKLESGQAIAATYEIIKVRARS